MYFLGFLLYVLVCGAVAWFLGKVLTRRATAPWARWAATAVLMPIVFLLPLADEIVGRFQFERLCEEAKEAKIYGTISVGEDLYTPGGKWRIGLQEGDFDQRRKDWDRARKVLDSYVRLELGPPQEIPAPISIRWREQKLLDARSGRLLAEWQSYSVGRGWFSEAMIPEGSLFGPQGCGPEGWKIEQIVLPFAKSTEVIR
jgi:hypothetical protein